MKLLRFSLCLLTLTAISPLRAQNEETKYLADSLPQRWEYYPSADGQIISLEDNWWANFNDEMLDSLVSMGLKANYDLRNAVNNINIALNTYKSNRSAYAPTLSAQAGWEKERISGRMYGNGSVTNHSYWNGQLGISWQVDLFGKVRDQVKSSKSLWQASQAEWAGTMLSVVSQIATEYVDLRVAQSELLLMQQHAESQLEIVGMAIARQEAGVGSMLDVAQAKTVYYSTLSNIPVYENTITNCLNSLAVLCGVMPEKLPAEIRQFPKRLPQYEQLIQTGIPMDLLRRRPDIIEAEKQIASYAALLGVAKKDFLPILTLEGTISTAASDMRDLFSRPSMGYSIAPTLSWNFDLGGAQTYNVRIAKDDLENGINSYNLTVLTAIEETNNAISSYYTSMKHIKMIEDVLIWAQKSLDMSIELYRSGLAAFTNVADAQETVLEYETELVEAQSDALTSLIQIYVALGGGWETSYIK